MKHYIPKKNQNFHQSYANSSFSKGDFYQSDTIAFPLIFVFESGNGSSHFGNSLLIYFATTRAKISVCDFYRFPLQTYAKAIAYHSLISLSSSRIIRLTMPFLPRYRISMFCS